MVISSVWVSTSRYNRNKKILKIIKIVTIIQKNIYIQFTDKLDKSSRIAQELIIIM